MRWGTDGSSRSQRSSKNEDFVTTQIYYHIYLPTLPTTVYFNDLEQTIGNQATTPNNIIQAYIDASVLCVT
jgi:hypothetical protein